MSAVPAAEKPMQRIMAVNHHLKVALDAVREGVLVVERAGRSGGVPAVLYGNRAMAEMAGVSVAQLSGMRLDRLVEDARGLLAGLGLEGEGKGREVEAALLGGGGRVGRLCQWRGVPVTEADGGVLSYILTVSERSSGGGMVRKYEGAPPQAGEWKQDVVDMVTDSARYVAHEFNNALTAILLPVEMVIGQLPAGSDLHGKLQVTYESARRAADLAKDFLDCFRPREPERVRCRLEPLLRRALRMATCAQNVDWSFEADGDLRDVLVDAGQIERLVLNLVRNACQAMPGGGRLLVTAVNHEVTSGQGLRPGPHVAISVRDWGPGIPQDYLPHLFNSRFTTKEDGNGCGLAICHQIARDHGGEIFVQSRPQVGTVFHVVLPALETAALAGVAEGTEGTEVAEGVGRGLAVAKGSGGRAMPSLLVVDDEEGIRFSLGAIAARLGCPVEVVSSGEEAIQRYRERHRSGRAHDMVILDINLKGMGGEEVFRELRRLDRGATVLATSGQYSDAELSRYEAMGFAGFLPKPFSVDEFREMLERFAAAV